MSDVDVDPFSREFLADPYASFRRLRDESPVHFVERRNMWMLTRWEDVNAAARNHGTFSSTGGVGYDWNPRPMMPMYDPPEHTRMRRMLARHFTPNAIANLKPRVQALVDDLVARAIELGEIDVVEHLALPLSLGTIAELLGVPRQHRANMRRWSQGTVEELAGALEGPPARRVDELRREFNVFLRSLIEERRAKIAEDSSAVDIISLLVAANEEDKLSQQELVAFCVLLMVAGFETTVNGMANAILALFQHPGEYAKLRENPQLASSAIEEAVRWDCPVLSFFRNTLADVTMHGVTIPKGAKVLLINGASGRDDRKFPDPDAFRVDRNPTDHLAYGAGIHYCLGAPLARLQMNTMLRTLLEHTARLEQTGDAVRTASVLFRGVKTLPARVIPAAGKVPAPRASGTNVAGAAAVLERAKTPRLEPKPFRLHVEDAVLGDLRERLARTRWPDQIDWAAWDYGTERAFLRSLCDHWRDAFDWRAQEEKLAQLPQRTVRLGLREDPDMGELDVHFVHIQPARAKLPLLVLHGYPGPFTLSSRIYGPLTEGDVSFEIVAPSLPGFPFTSAPRTRGMGPMKMADLFARLMAGLGHERYGVVGEGLGAAIASRLALAYPNHVVGIHVGSVEDDPPRDQLAALGPEERAWLKTRERVREKELALLLGAASRPQTLAYALADSPAGLLGWLVDRYRTASDCDGDIERVFSKDDLLVAATLHWVANTGGASLRAYYEAKQLPWFLAKGERIEVPVAVTFGRREPLRPPRAWIERVLRLEQLTELEGGGSFGAWERPAEVAAAIRTFFAGRG